EARLLTRLQHNAGPNHCVEARILRGQRVLPGSKLWNRVLPSVIYDHTSAVVRADIGDRDLRSRHHCSRIIRDPPHNRCTYTLRGQDGYEEENRNNPISENLHRPTSLFSTEA